FGKEKYVKGERTSLRFRVRNPSTGPARTKVKVDINFVKGKIRRPSGISKRKMYLQALTRYTGNKLSYVDPNTDTLFDLPVSIADNPGDYTVIITITPTADKDLIIGNNTIYGYFKVVFKTLKLKIIK
ncbi:MAG: hypothetical protein KAR14_02375, partial [Candidatus Aminicenantes bacterium]|nr:hypothetical protein [Candidatus Aminicenantes bacterium]